MNKTKAFINRVVIGVTLMTLAACEAQLEESFKAGQEMEKGNNITQETQLMNQGQQGAIIEMPQER